MINIERESISFSNKGNIQKTKKEISFSANNRFATIKNVPEYIVTQVDQKIKEDKELQVFCPEAKHGTPQHIKKELQKYLSTQNALKKEILASMPEQQAINTFMAYSLTSYFMVGNELTLLNFNKNKHNVEKQAHSINSSIKQQDKRTFPTLVISVIEAEFKKSGIINDKFSPKAKAEVAQFISTRETVLREILSVDKKVEESGRKKLNKITNELYLELKNKGIIENQENDNINVGRHSSSNKSPVKSLYSIGIGLLESLLLLQNAAQPVMASISNDAFRYVSNPDVTTIVDKEQNSDQIRESMKNGGYVTSDNAASFISGSPDRFKELANSKAKATPNMSWNELFVHNGNDKLYFSTPPTKEELKNLQTMANILEVIRQSLGNKSIKIISGYRPSPYNATIPGAATNSQHTYANAIDFYVPGMDIQDVEKSIDAMPISIEYSQKSGKTTIHIDNRLRTQGVISRFAWNSDGSITTVGYYNKENQSKTSGKPLYLKSFDDINFNYFSDRGLDIINGENIAAKPEFEYIAKAYQVKTPSNMPQAPKIVAALPQNTATDGTVTDESIPSETNQPTVSAESNPSTVNESANPSNIKEDGNEVSQEIKPEVDASSQTKTKKESASANQTEEPASSLFAKPSNVQTDTATPVAIPDSNSANQTKVKVGIDDLSVNPSINDVKPNIAEGSTTLKSQQDENITSQEEKIQPESKQTEVNENDTNTENKGSTSVNQTEESASSLFAKPSSTPTETVTPVATPDSNSSSQTKTEVNENDTNKENKGNTSINQSEEPASSLFAKPSSAQTDTVAPVATPESNSSSQAKTEVNENDTNKENKGNTSVNQSEETASSLFAKPSSVQTDTVAPVATPESSSSNQTTIKIGIDDLSVNPSINDVKPNIAEGSTTLKSQQDENITSQEEKIQSERESSLQPEINDDINNKTNRESDKNASDMEQTEENYNPLFAKPNSSNAETVKPATVPESETGIQASNLSVDTPIESISTDANKEKISSLFAKPSNTPNVNSTKETNITPQSSTSENTLPMKSTSSHFRALKYEKLLTTMKVKLTNAQKSDLAHFKEIYEQNKDRYENVARKLGVKEELVPLTGKAVWAIHAREGSCNFDTYLHNGQKLGQVTTLTPKGIYFDNWEDSAVDALKKELKKFNGRVPESVPEWLSFSEVYNALYYEMAGIPSAYVLSGTDAYTSGKMMNGGKINPNIVDAQVGVAVLLTQ